VRPARNKLPLLGGTLSISIIETRTGLPAGGGSSRSAQVRILNEVAESSKLGDMRPSDQLESLQFSVKWEPVKGALAATVPPEELTMSKHDLIVVCVLY
jgi:mediator of RNA polymerase II transcription subunit 14